MSKVTHIAATILLCALQGAQASAWDYQEVVDRMTGKKTRMAVMKSDNSLRLQFPYQGTNYGYVQVRQHPTYGLDVIVYVDKGQILCSQVTTCTVRVRFGDSQPLTFSGSPSADHDSTTVFLNNPRRFIEQAKKHQRLAIQLSMYQAGDQILEFSVPAALKW